MTVSKFVNRDVLVPLMGDTVIARVDLKPTSDNGLNGHRSHIPATTLGIVMNRLAGNPALVQVNWGCYGIRYVHAADIAVVESCEVLTDFVQGFGTGQVLIDLLISQFGVIVSLQGQVEKRDLQMAQLRKHNANLQRERDEALAALTEALEQQAAQTECVRCGSILESSDGISELCPSCRAESVS